MAKPFIHAKNSVKRYGGKEDDYIEIHNFMDSSKAATGISTHRFLTHNTWFISNVIERVFGVTIKNSAGRLVSTRDIAEQHVLEDYKMKFIPTAQDFLQEMEIKPWMLNGIGFPPSCEKLNKKENFKVVD